MVSPLVGVVSVRSNAQGHQSVVSGYNAAIPFDLQADVFRVETRGQARQDDVCLNFGVRGKQVHRWRSWKGKP